MHQEKIALLWPISRSVGRVLDFDAEGLWFDPTPKYFEIYFEITSAELPEQPEVQKFERKKLLIYHHS